ncbi:hypothetical protein B7463_g8756, partial [Scytalidium lignicola]
MRHSASSSDTGICSYYMSVNSKSMWVSLYIIITSKRLAHGSHSVKVNRRRREKMPLHLSPATEADVEEIASLRITSFSKNVLLHAQFPTEEAIRDFHQVLVGDLLEAIRDVTRAVLLVRDVDTNIITSTDIDTGSNSTSNQIIGFAEWKLPVSEAVAHPPFTWPKSSRQDYLDEYGDKARDAIGRVVGNQPCYHLTFLGTHPDFRCRGIGTMLVNWGLERARIENIPVYLESEVAASSLYRKLGFKIADRFSMTLAGMRENGGSYIYEEVCMLRTWQEDEGDEGDDGDDEEEEDDDDDDDDDIESLDRWDSGLEIQSLKLDYAVGIKPQTVVEAIYERIEVYKSKQPSVWIHLQPIEVVKKEAGALLTRWPDPVTRPPLWGIPFSVKDSIDVAGIPTTIGCPALAYRPTTSAPVFQRCIDAGALFIGKTNLEQLATGMTGCRSPYGTLHSKFNEEYIVGGSSSGSAVSIAANLVSFSLGSDTAGSIRVPALFNGIVGFKPTKGTVSARGLAPACKHQDCVSFLTGTVADAETVWNVCKGYDKGDLFAKVPRTLPSSFGSQRNQHKRISNLRFSFGIPPTSVLEACCPEYVSLFKVVVKTLQSAGGKLIDIDWTPFAIANDLLYNGTFVLERLTTLPEGWFDKNKGLLHTVIRQVFEGAVARNSSAVDVFRDLHKQAECKRAVEEILTLEVKGRMDEDEMAYNRDDEDKERKTGGVLTVMVVPTAPFHPKIEDVLKDPIGVNSQLGIFAHFANVLDLAGIAVPCGSYGIAGETKDRRDEVRLPFGVTILAGSGLDEQLIQLANRVEDDLWGVDLDD